MSLPNDNECDLCDNLDFLECFWMNTVRNTPVDTEIPIAPFNADSSKLSFRKDQLSSIQHDTHLSPTPWEIDPRRHHLPLPFMGCVFFLVINSPL